MKPTGFGALNMERMVDIRNAERILAMKSFGNRPFGRI
jgi:hypothetical protein